MKQLKDADLKEVRAYATELVREAETAVRMMKMAEINLKFAERSTQRTTSKLSETQPGQAVRGIERLEQGILLRSTPARPWRPTGHGWTSPHRVIGWAPSDVKTESLLNAITWEIEKGEIVGGQGVNFSIAQVQLTANRLEPLAGELTLRGQ